MNRRENFSTPLGVSVLLSDKSSGITTDDCSYYGRVNTTGFGLIRSYEGIPENLIVNLIVTAVRSGTTLINTSPLCHCLDPLAAVRLPTTSIFGFEEHRRWNRVRII